MCVCAKWSMYPEAIKKKEIVGATKQWAWLHASIWLPGETEIDKADKWEEKWREKSKGDRSSHICPHHVRGARIKSPKDV